MPKKVYNEDSIQRFAGLSGIRKKPQVYVGPMDGGALWTLWREPADNAVDQALAGRNRTVHLVQDGPRYWVLDEGEGIPVGSKAFADEHGRTEQLSTFYVTTGLTHGGGNFSGENVSRGTHGIGIKNNSALSTSAHFWTYRDRKWYTISYVNAQLTNAKAKNRAQACKAPKLPYGLKLARGTAVCFEPDLKLFAKGSRINAADPVAWCELTSYLVAGLTVKLTLAKGKTRTFVSKRGPLDYLDKRTTELKCEPLGKPFVFNNRELDVAISFANCEGMEIGCYTNGLLNVDGGRHLDAWFDALVKALLPYKGKLEYTPSDLRDGVLGLVNAKLAAPQFSNQVKAKLVDDRIYPLAQPALLAALGDYFAKNKTLAKDVCTRAAELRKRTADFLKDKQLARNVKTAKKSLASKLSDVHGKTPFNQRELLLVEGDSAGGGLKRARDKSFQAVFPLRGKPLNVMETTKDKINGNVEIAGIFAAIGLDLTAKDPTKSLRYGKIIFAADADVDGSHISVLLLAIFYRFLPSLIRDGCVYILQSPEYYAIHKDVYVFGASPEEVYAQTKTRSSRVCHLKGLGELSEEGLQQVATAPATRQLVQVTATNAAGRRKFEALLGKDTSYRKQLMGVE